MKLVCAPSGRTGHRHSLRCIGEMPEDDECRQRRELSPPSWQLAHRNSTVTRAVYIQEIKSAE